MKKLAKSMKKQAALLVSLLLFCHHGAAQPAPARVDSAAPSSYDQQVHAANGLFNQGQLEEARHAAQQAIHQDASRYEGYVLAAKIAAKQGASADAAKFLQIALKMAPDDVSKAKVQQLAANITPAESPAPPQIPTDPAQVFADHVKAGDEAAEGGLAYKAAREYTIAFNASPSHADIGMKAARLWLEHQELLEAVRVLNRMKTQSLPPQIESQVNQILGDNYQPLAIIFQEQTSKGWQILNAANPGPDGFASAAQHFRDALQARYSVNPSSGSDLDEDSSPYVGLALSAAAAGDVTGAIHALTLGSKAGLKVNGNYFTSPLWNSIRKDAAFQQFLQDAFGDKTAQAAARAAVPPAQTSRDNEDIPAHSEFSMAYAEIAQEYRSGQSREVNAKVAQLSRNAAELGNSAAQVRQGNMYLGGFGVKQDAKEALKWFRKAADQGDAAGQLSLGWMYEKGLSVNKDLKEAAKWYRKAADQRNADAIHALDRLKLRPH
jgi:hypothetical protein